MLGALKRSLEDGPFQNDTIGYQYDAMGRVTARTVDASTERFTYDLLDRPASSTNALGTFDYSFLGQTGQITRRMLHGGTLLTSWDYDTNTNDRRLKKIVNSGATRSYQYTTTPRASSVKSRRLRLLAALLRHRRGTTPTTMQTVFSRGHLPVELNYHYNYDPVDNLTVMQGPAGTKSGSYNSVNQLTGFGGQAVAYDPNGNITDDGTRTYKWDAEDRLIKVSYKAQPARSTMFRYDGVGRRIAIISNDGASSTEIRYLWCGQSLCQSRNANDIVIRRYYSEGEAISAAGTLLYYSRDHLGSVRDVVAVQNGSRVAAFDYDPYGNPSQTSGRVFTDLRYAGMFYEQNSGLYLTNHRAYDPRTGRWLSRDPIYENGGLNVYGYVRSNPVNWIDVVGLAIGDFPPPPPGFDPKTWTQGQWSNGKWYVKDPSGNTWTAHPEDPGHWRHWDKQDSGGDDEGQQPPNSGKPRPNQKKLGSGQCDADPNGNAPPWTPLQSQQMNGNVPNPIIPVIPVDPIPFPEFPVFEFPIFEPIFIW